MSLPTGFTEVSTIAVASAMYDTPAQTNSQTVSGIWSAADNYAKYLFFRGNADFTTYCYVKIQSNTPPATSGTGKCEIGCVVAGVRAVLGTFALPTAAPGYGLFQANQNYQCVATDYTFTVTGPGGLTYSFTDSSHVSQMGQNYVYGGFGTDGWGRATQQILASGTYAVPDWTVNGTLFDIGAHGNGGSAWEFKRLAYGPDIPLITGGFAISMGGAGTDTTVSIAGYGDVTGVGGSTSGFVLGVFENNAISTTNPLAVVWAIDTTVPGSMYSWAFSDSGPTTGPAVDSLPGTQSILSNPSGTFMDLPTPGPSATVNIGPSKLAWVSFGVNQMWGAAAGTDGIVTVKCTGANTIAADTTNPCLRYHTPATGQVAGTGSSRSDLWEFDNEGATEFALQYASTGGHTVTFDTPSISVIPL